MPHCDPDGLALAALGEPLAAVDAAHLADCARCSAEVTSLRRAVDALGTDDVVPVPPPARVWDAIAAATGATSRPPSPPIDLAARRTRRARVGLGLGVAASLLIGLGAGVVIGRDAAPRPGTPALSGTEVAATELEPLGGRDVVGQATLLDADGALQLRVDLPDLPAPAGYYEVWLLGREPGELLALGVLDSSSALYPLPADVDLALYGTVDVSLEPFDGDPGHSSDSVARGSLS